MRIFLLMLFTCSTAFAGDYQLYFKSDMFLISESVSIREAIDDWDDSFHSGGKNQLGSLWIESGVKKTDWLFAILHRQEIQLQYHPDTADFYHSIDNDIPLEATREYVIDLKAQRFKATGIRIARQLELTNKLQLELGISWFKTTDLLDGLLTGSVVANSSTEYDYSGEVNYYYDKDSLFERPNVIEPSGTGASIDLKGQWYISNNFKLSTKIIDLLGLIYWKNAPFTKANVSSKVISEREEGLQEIKPVISGIEGYDKTYTQQLNTYVHTNLRYKKESHNYALLLNTKYYTNFFLTGLGTEFRIKNFNISSVYWLQSKSVELGILSDKFSFFVHLDSLNSKQIKTLGISLGYNWYR